MKDYFDRYAMPKNRMVHFVKGELKGTTHL